MPPVKREVPLGGKKSLSGLLKRPFVGPCLAGILSSGVHTRLAGCAKLWGPALGRKSLWGSMVRPVVSY